MRSYRLVFSLGVLPLLAASCGPLPGSITTDLQGATSNVSQIVKATFQALTAEASQGPTSTPAGSASPSEAGSISGTLTYPADSLPALYVVAYQTGTQNYRYVTTSAGQGKFAITDLPPGTYHVVAYTVGGGGFPQGLAGGFTQAVACGSGPTCTDHSLIDVTVTPGQQAAGINPGDWFAPSGAFPQFPGQGSVEASTATMPPSVQEGAIAGTLMYPASGIPSLRIVAFSANSSAFYYVDTVLGQSSYLLQHLPPGTYHVVAYPLPGGASAGGPAGGYSQMVPCGLKYGCSDHTLLDVVVTAGGTTSGVDPNDYYADPGSFPPNPVP